MPGCATGPLGLVLSVLLLSASRAARAERARGDDKFSLPPLRLPLRGAAGREEGLPRGRLADKGDLRDTARGGGRGLVWEVPHRGSRGRNQFFHARQRSSVAGGARSFSQLPRLDREALTRYREERARERERITLARTAQTVGATAGEAVVALARVQGAPSDNPWDAGWVPAVIPSPPSPSFLALIAQQGAVRGQEAVSGAAGERQDQDQGSESDPPSESASDPSESASVGHGAEEKGVVLGADLFGEDGSLPPRRPGLAALGRGWEWTEGGQAGTPATATVAPATDHREEEESGRNEEEEESGRNEKEEEESGRKEEEEEPDAEADLEQKRQERAEYWRQQSMPHQGRNIGAGPGPYPEHTSSSSPAFRPAATSASASAALLSLRGGGSAPAPAGVPRAGDTPADCRGADMALPSMDESYGFMCDDDASWSVRRAIARFQAGLQDLSAPFVMGTYWQENWEPEFSCSFERRVGPRGDGGKWMCDPHKLSLTPSCLVYSLGSENDFRFEESILRDVGRHCEIHTFDHTVAGPRVPRGVTFHPWGLRGRVADHPNHMAVQHMAKRMKGVLFDLEELVEKTGHTGDPIDVLKIDVEGAEFIALTVMLEDGSFEKLRITQVLIEIHAHYPKEMHRLFRAFRSAGYAIFHKEPNIQHVAPGGRFCVEFGFIRLRTSFWGADAVETPESANLAESTSETKDAPIGWSGPGGPHFGAQYPGGRSRSTRGDSVIGGMEEELRVAMKKSFADRRRAAAVGLGERIVHRRKERRLRKLAR